MALFVLREGFQVESTPTGGRVVHMRTGDALDLTAPEVQLLARATTGGVDSQDAELRPLLKKLARMGLLVQAAGKVNDLEASLQPAQAPKPPPIDPEAVVPRLRRDLQITRNPDSPLYQATDPKANRTFSLYDFELSLARMLDGRRRVREVIEAGGKLGIPVNSESLAKFIRQLERYGFLVGPGSQSSEDPNSRQPRERWGDDLRGLFQNGLKLVREGRLAEAAPFFEAMLAQDPTNQEARERLAEVHQQLGTAAPAPTVDFLSPPAEGGEASWVSELPAEGLDAEIPTLLFSAQEAAPPSIDVEQQPADADHQVAEADPAALAALEAAAAGDFVTTAAEQAAAPEDPIAATVWDVAPAAEDSAAAADWAVAATIEPVTEVGHEISIEPLPSDGAVAEPVPFDAAVLEPVPFDSGVAEQLPFDAAVAGPGSAGAAVAEQLPFDAAVAGPGSTGAAFAEQLPFDAAAVEPAAVEGAATEVPSEGAMVVALPAPAPDAGLDWNIDSLPTSLPVTPAVVPPPGDTSSLESSFFDVMPSGQAVAQEVPMPQPKNPPPKSPPKGGLEGLFDPEPAAPVPAARLSKPVIEQPKPAAPPPAMSVEALFEPEPAKADKPDAKAQAGEPPRRSSERVPTPAAAPAIAPPEPELPEIAVGRSSKLPLVLTAAIAAGAAFAGGWFLGYRSGEKSAEAAFAARAPVAAPAVAVKPEPKPEPKAQAVAAVAVAPSQEQAAAVPAKFEGEVPPADPVDSKIPEDEGEKPAAAAATEPAVPAQPAEPVAVAALDPAKAAAPAEPAAKEPPAQPAAATEPAAAAAAEPAGSAADEITVAISKVGRVTMCMLTAPADGPVKWTAPAAQRIRKGQVVGTVGGAQLSTTCAGLLIPLIEDDGAAATGESLADILYHQGYLKTLVPGSRKPEASWGCEVVDEATGKTTSCTINQAAPKAGGFFITAIYDPMWVDTAEKPQLRLTPK